LSIKFICLFIKVVVGFAKNGQNRRDYVIKPKLARKLLVSFGSVRGVLLASREELLAAFGLGKKICDRIFGVLDLEFS